jgi:hypothetical protein
MRNQPVGQYHNRRVPLAAELWFSRWVDSEHWQYFPEKSTNPENFFATRLFADGYAIMAQDEFWNWKFVADFWRSHTAFREKLQILHFISIAKGSETFRTCLGLVSLESSWSNLVSGVSELSR